jgi:hypothetical protein
MYNTTYCLCRHTYLLDTTATFLWNDWNSVLWFAILTAQVRGLACPLSPPAQEYCSSSTPWHADGKGVMSLYPCWWMVWWESVSHVCIKPWCPRKGNRGYLQRCLNYSALTWKSGFWCWEHTVMKEGLGPFSRHDPPIVSSQLIHRIHVRASNRGQNQACH